MGEYVKTSNSSPTKHAAPEPGSANYDEWAATQAGDHSQETPVGDLGADLGATAIHHSGLSGQAELQAERGTKQCRDLAFAVAAMQLGFVNSRILGQATRSWTTHGEVALAEHLLACKLITSEQRRQAETRSQRRLAKLAASNSHGGGDGSGSPELSLNSREQHWLQHLDPTGKVAKLLGIADTSVLTSEEIEDRTIGSRYTLLRKLGQGGLGVVWLARDQNLQRYVAVKEISRNVPAGDPSLEHFRREAEITGRLEHPGIVPVYQYGDDEATGKAFYVMRFLGKKTLHDAITEYHERRESGSHDPMLRHRLLSALISICNSVSHAHSRKVIHRDLKPENIALNEFGQVTLLDWGLAKINDATGMYDIGGRDEPGDLHSVGSSQVGRVLGTPLYMSPEQAAGRLDEVDELSDVYALGGILYAILTGISPHQSLIDQADSSSSQSDILSRIVGGTIKPPHELLASVPPELSAVCMKALAKKRYLRYESAAELSDDLQRFMAGAEVSAYTPPFKQRMLRWMAKHPTLAQSILLASSLLLIGAGMIGYTARQGRLALQHAQYHSVQEFSRELEVNLKFETRALERNLHFMSELPLMEAVVYSQRRLAASEHAGVNPQSNSHTANPTPPISPATESPATESPVNTVLAISSGDTATGYAAAGDTATGYAAAGDTAAGDTATGDTATGDTAAGDTAAGDKPASRAIAPQVSNISATAPSSIFGNLNEGAIQVLHEIDPNEWRDRLGNMFDGLLNANPSYLVATTFEKHDDGSADELIRSERATAGGRVRRVPAVQLIHCPSTTTRTAEEALQLSALRPDEVTLITNDQLSAEIPASTRSPLVLSGLRAIFDTEGKYFGANVIELDLARRLEELCNAVAPEHVSVYITDVDGNIVMSYRDGRASSADGSESITEKFPDLKTFFTENAKAGEQGDQRTYLARRVHFDNASGKAQIVIVSHIL